MSPLSILFSKLQLWKLADRADTIMLLCCFSDSSNSFFMTFSSFSRLWMRELVASIAALRWADWCRAASRWSIAPSVTGSLHCCLRDWLLSAGTVKMERRVLSCSINMARTMNLNGIVGFCTASKRSWGERLLQSIELHIWVFCSSVILPLYAWCIIKKEFKIIQLHNKEKKVQINI